jgi:hypothetical protein
MKERKDKDKERDKKTEEHVKKTYIRPILFEYGDVETLTQAGGQLSLLDGGQYPRIK